MTPRRFQRRRVKGYRLPPNTVSVTRDGPLGNPFRPIDPKNPEHVRKAVDYFRRYLEPGQHSFACGPAGGVTLAFIPAWTHAGELRRRIDALRGRNVACYCAEGALCHGDVILERANR